MSSHSGNGDSIRGYLLGELSEPEREQVEQRLMSDDTLYERLLLAEDDLIDEYVSGTLSDGDRVKFSRRFLQVPTLRQDVRSVVALRKHALETAPQVTTGRSSTFSPSLLIDWLRKFFIRPIIGVAFASALLVAVLVAVWLAAQNLQLRKQVEQLRAGQVPPPTPQPELREALAAEKLRNEQLSAELQRQRELLAEETRKLQETQGRPQPVTTPKPDSSSGMPAVFAFALGTGAVRESGEMKKVSVPPSAREVRIQLDLATADYRRYRAVLLTVEGREVLPFQGLRAGRGRFVQLNIPAKFLTPGDYQIRLSGVNPSGEADEIDSYYFRVLK